MEVRCGSCNKLFRVSDEKITGAGVKFPCTRCGEYVKITRAAFDQYTLSQSAVSARDMFEPELVPAEFPVQPASFDKETEKLSDVSSPQDFDLASSSAHDVAEEDQILSFFEPPAAAESERMPEPSVEPEHDDASSERDLGAMPRFTDELDLQLRSELQPQQINIEANAGGGQGIEPFAPREAENKESIRSTPSARVKSSTEVLPAPTRSRTMIAALIVAIMVIGLAGYVAFTSLQAPPPQEKVREIPREMITNEGLNVTNAAGVVENNGDLLITGVVENTLDKEKRTWYIVVAVYDAQGNILTKIGLLNGRQIHKRKDYDILSKRGVNVKELKAKSLHEQGTVIPSKGSVTFELRCLQPPVGIATFNATPQTVDPVQLNREIAEELK